MPKRLTIRGVPEEVGQRLEGLSRARGQSVNTTVLEILGAAVGVDQRGRRPARYATWTPEDLTEFNEALAAQRVPRDYPEMVAPVPEGAQVVLSIDGET
jgi:plasmid stability protein